MNAESTKMRLSLIRGGWWDDRILVFTDRREIWTRHCSVRDDGMIRVVGTDRETQTQVDEVINPADVRRVCCS